MAEMIETVIQDIKTVDIERRDGSGSFSKLEISGDDGKIYSGIKESITGSFKVGDKVTLLFQPVKTQSGQMNSLIKVTQAGQSQEQQSIKSDNQTAPWENQQVNKPVEVKSETLSIKGKTFYAHVKTANTTGKFPSNKFQLDLAISDKLAVALKQLGVDVKNKADEKGNFVRLRSTKQPIVSQLVDTGDGEVTDVKLTADEIPLFGNGTEVVINTRLYPNKATQGGKMCLGLNSIKIVNLVEYTNTGRPLVDE